MKLFDARLLIGRNKDLNPFQSSDISSLKRMLDKYKIKNALLSSFASTRLDFVYGNDMVFDAAKEEPRLIPCPVVLPNTAGETGEESKFIDGLIVRGARCVGFYPASFNLSLHKRVIGRLFSAIEERRLPVLLPYEELGLEATTSLLGSYPKVPFIYSNVLWRDDAGRRNLNPVLEEFKNLHIDTVAPPNRGIEDIVERFGSERMVFASNFPAMEPGASITYLFYSEIDESDLENIAFRNMERLIGGIRT